MVEISIAAFLLSVGLFFVVLPSIVVNIDPLIKSYPLSEQLSRSSIIIGWVGQIILFLIMLMFIGLFSYQYKFSGLLTNLLKAFLLPIILVCIVSYIYIFFTHPELLNNIDAATQLFSFYQYPALVSIYIGSPQWIWIITSGAQITMFIGLFYQSAYILH